MSMTAVAVAKDGARLVVAWKDQRAGASRVWWSSAAADAKFSNDVPLDEKATAEQDHPALTFDAAGEAWIVWEEGRGEGARLKWRSGRVGDAPHDLADARAGVPAFPVLAGGAGFVAVAWETTGAGGERVVATVVETEARGK